MVASGLMSAFNYLIPKGKYLQTTRPADCYVLVSSGATSGYSDSHRKTEASSYGPRLQSNPVSPIETVKPGQGGNRRSNQYRYLI